jgi:two-component system, OmpR family, sensor kinase
MLFDDRLATVLRLSATGEAGQRTQFRQLLDLMGNRPQPLHAHEGLRDQSLLAAAWLRMDVLADAIPATERARMIREPGWRFRSPELAAHLSEQEPDVAAAALARAELTAEQWTALIPYLPIRARGFLRLRRDLPLDAEALLGRLGVHDRGLPPPEAQEAEPLEESRPARSAVHLRAVPNEPAAGAMTNLPPSPQNDRAASERSEISALVERIAQFRRERSEAAEELDLSPRLPLGETPETPRRVALALGFVADASGRIEWASSDFAPMVIGMRLVRPMGLSSNGEVPDLALARAFARRQPIVRAPLTLDGAPAIAGEWLVDAEPRFSSDGHFTGYLGRLRRPPPAPVPAEDAVAREADHIRQLLHELRTPITAVQGYAEVIQQQLFGPAPHEYRALAAAIAADAAHILAGFEELDRLARLETGALAMSPGEVDLATLVRGMAGQLTAVLNSKGAGLVLADDRDASLLAAINEDEAEALLWRVLATLAGSCKAGEQLAIRMTPVFQGPAAMAQVTCDLPARLCEASDLFASEIRPGDQAISAGLFGAGFSLRLARAEAMRAGGALKSESGQVTLHLPLITGAETNPKAIFGSTSF